tara:strand:- start:139 stop:510 length:372 start_codon:yes stop_codon:yes gene_type:complete
MSSQKNNSSAYIAIRSHKLKSEVDRATFEKSFEDIPPFKGLKKVLLLKGYEGDLNVAKGEVDYISIHIYENAQACEDFFKDIRPDMDEAEILSFFPEELHPWIRSIAMSESTVFGYDPIHGNF